MNFILTTDPLSHLPFNSPVEAFDAKITRKLRTKERDNLLSKGTSEREKLRTKGRNPRPLIADIFLASSFEIDADLAAIRQRDLSCGGSNGWNNKKAPKKK